LFANEYVTVTRRAADAFRGLLRDYALPEWDTRHMLLSILRGAQEVESYEGGTGTVRVLRAGVKNLAGFTGEVEVTLVYGAWPDGTPKLAPDGTKRAVFLTDFRPGPFGREDRRRLRLDREAGRVVNRARAEADRARRKADREDEAEARALAKRWAVTGL
jgi:hypothetical protein